MELHSCLRIAVMFLTFFGLLTHPMAQTSTSAARLPDSVRVKVLSLTPDQKVVQGVGQLSRVLVFSASVDTTVLPVARLNELTLNCQFSGVSSLVLTGTVPASFTNGKCILTLSGLHSNGKPVVVSNLPGIFVDTDPPKLDATAILVNGRSLRILRSDTFTVDISGANKSTDAASGSIAIDQNTPTITTNGKAVFSKVPEGTHSIRVITFDKAGNQSQVAEVPIVIDHTPPDLARAVVTIGNGKPIVSTSKITIKVSGIKDINGIKTIWCRLGSNSPRQMASDSTIIELTRDGADTVEIWAEDSAGNSSTHLKKSIIRDTKSPAVSTTIDRFWNSGTHIATWNFDEPMDTSVVGIVRFDSATVSTRWTTNQTLRGSVMIDSSSRNGNRQLTLVSAVDCAGNPCKRLLSDVTIDTRPPELSLKNIAVNKGDLSVSCDSTLVTVSNVTDPSGVIRYRYSLDGKVIADTSSERLTFRKLQNGKHELTLTARDGANNTTIPLSIMFIVDASRPGIKGATAGSGDTVSGRFPITIAFTKAMDTTIIPGLKIEEGALADAHWLDTISLVCMYNPEKKGPIDTVKIRVKNGRDRGGLQLDELESVCVMETDTVFHFVRFLAKKGNHDQAIKVLQKLSKSQPYRADIAELWANESREAKDQNSERQAMECLADLRPADKDLLRSLINLTSKMGDRKASKIWLKQLMVAEGKLDVVSSADYRKEGRSFFQLAQGAFLRSKNADEAAALVAEGIIAVQAGEPRRAHDAFSSALSLDSSCMEAVYNIATLQLLNNKPLEAEAALARCASTDERFASNYAVAMAMSGRIESALKLFTERKISLDDPGLAGVYGVLLIRSGKTSEALPYLEKAATTGTIQRINYAFGLYTAKEFAKSKAIFATCGTAAADSFPEILYGKALTELQLDNKDAAIADLQAAVAIQPVYLDAQLKLGELLMKQKNRAGARHALSFAARADSTNSAAHQALAAMYQETGETDLARTESMKAARPPQKDTNAMTVAVEQFKNVTGDSLVNWLSVGMAEALSTEMTRFSPYRMLERIQIEAITRRMALKQAIGAETAAEESQLGKALGANAIVAGSYQLAGKNLRIDGRLIDVQTGNILTTGSATGTFDELSRIQRTLALILSGRSDALELSELPGGVSVDAQQRMALAKKALYNGNTEEAKKLAGEALKIDPLALSLAGSMAVAMTSEGRGKSMAVLPFDDLTGGNAKLGPGIQEALITNLRKAGNLAIVERSQIDKVTAEIGLGQTGLVKESSAATAGEMLAAGIVLTGGYQIVSDKIRITAKMLDVMTGEILLATDVTGKKDALFSLEDQLAARIIQALKGVPVVDSTNRIDLSKKHSIDTSASPLEQKNEQSNTTKESTLSYEEKRQAETYSRRLTFFTTPLGLNIRGQFSTLNSDVGFHFLNTTFAIDGLYETSINDLFPENLQSSDSLGPNSEASISTHYRSLEMGAGWNFLGGLNSNNTQMTFGQLRIGFKSLSAPEATQRVDSLPPYMNFGGTTYNDTNDITINTTQGILYAGLGIVSKKAEDGRRKSFRFYTDFLYAPFLDYSVTNNDGSLYSGYTNALVLQRIGARLGFERTYNGRIGLRWLLEAGVRPGVHNAIYNSYTHNFYLNAKIGVCTSWF